MEAFVHGRFSPCSMWLGALAAKHADTVPPVEAPSATADFASSPVDDGRPPHQPPNVDPREGGKKRRGRPKVDGTLERIGLSVGVGRSSMSKYASGDQTMTGAVWTGLLVRLRGPMAADARPPLSHRVCCGFANAIGAMAVMHQTGSLNSTVARGRAFAVFPAVFASWAWSTRENNAALSAGSLAAAIKCLREDNPMPNNGVWASSPMSAENLARAYIQHRDSIECVLVQVSTVVRKLWGNEPDPQPLEDGLHRRESST